MAFFRRPVKTSHFFLFAASISLSPVNHSLSFRPSSPPHSVSPLRQQPKVSCLSAFLPFCLSLSACPSFCLSSFCRSRLFVLTPRSYSNNAPHGSFNMTSLKNAPVHISKPLFLDADPSYRNNIDGNSTHRSTAQHPGACCLRLVHDANGLHTFRASIVWWVGASAQQTSYAFLRFEEGGPGAPQRATFAFHLPSSRLVSPLHPLNFFRRISARYSGQKGQQTHLGLGGWPRRHFWRCAFSCRS